MLRSVVKRVLRCLGLYHGHVPGRYRFGQSGTLTVEVHDGEPPEAQMLRASLHTYNGTLVGETGYRALHVLLRDTQSRVVGGLLGSTFWGNFAISHVWINPEHRGHGHSVRLFQAAEAEAARRGCGNAYLDTFTFQRQVSHYQKLGFEIFGTLNDFPPGHSRVFMRKKLNQAALRPDNSSTNAGVRAAGN